MKNISLLIILFTASLAIAQSDIEEDVESFETIKVFDLITVNLVKADRNSIAIKGEDTDEVDFINRNGTLKIRMKSNKSFRGEDTFVYVYYTDIEVIDANEGSRIITNELIEQDSIELRTQEGAQIEAGLKVNKLEVRAVTGGIIQASGTATKQDVVVNTGGIVENRGLRTKRSTVKVQAGGEVEVYASKKVDVRVNAGGDVIVYGDPSNVKEKTVFGGSITVK